MTGRYIRSTSVEDQSEFVEHLQIGKQIGKLLDMPKGPQAQKHMFWVWNMKKLKKNSFFDYVRNEAMLVLVFYLFSKKVFFSFLAKTNLGSRRKIIYLDHGPQGPWAQPLFDCVAVPFGFVLFGKKRV